MLTYVIYGATNIDLWVDCVPEPGVYSGTGGNLTYSGTSASTSIGANGGAQGIVYTTGSLDEIRFYNRALTQADVNALYGLGTLNADLGPDQSTCSPVVLNPGANPGAAYLWSTGATTQTITASTSGTYWVQVTKGCAVRRDTVMINMAPTATVNAGADQAICPGASAFIWPTINGAGSNSAVLWSTGATSLTLTTPNPGTYWVQVSTPCGVVRDTVVVTQIPPATVSLGPDKVLCSGTTLSLTPTVSATGSTVLQWNNGQISNSLTINNPGTYWVTLNTACGTVRDSIIITGLPSPVLSLGPDKTLCASTTTLVATGNAMQVQWAGPGIVSSSGMAATVNQSGLYIVTGYSDNGCQGTDTVQITLVTAPVVNLGADTTVCDSFVLDAGYPGSSYLWSTGATSRVVTYNASGTYWVQVTPQPGCFGSDTILVNVVGTPVANFTATWMGGNTVQFLNNSVHATSFEWLYDGPGGSTVTDTVKHPLITFPTPGNRFVQLISSNTCGSDTVLLPLDWEALLLPVSPAAAQKIHVFPNPATASFRVTGLTAGIPLVLVNALGQTVWEGTSCETLDVSVSDLAEGVYWLRAPGNAVGAKVVVKR